MKNLTRKISDADYSNAGDDFHIVWAIRKSLDLLNFEKDGLKAVVIEGIERESSEKIDPSGEKLLGVDMSEYYGGTDFKSANKIIISQLKYSTTSASDNYTFSELYKGKKSKSTDGSIIHRLANIYTSFYKEYGRDSVLDKVQIKLISNRSFSDQQLKVLLQIQELESQNQNKTKFSTVVECVTTYKKGLERLFKASNLGETEFIDFIRVLSFSECGTDSRYILKNKILRSISKLSTSSSIQFNFLFQLIWNKIQPESRKYRQILLEDLLGTFGVNSIDDLFPVKSQFSIANNAIEREQLKSIVNILTSNVNNDIVCIHGGAGIGKSTIIQQIKRSLSTQSECFLFDCYGNGDYRNPDDKRHLHRYAITHISNELAKKIGSDFLLLKNGFNEDYLKEFKRRIKSSVEIIRRSNSQASLYIIIDAADNSIFSARESDEKSFIQDLLKLAPIDGCNIVLTCRTNRMSSLVLPPQSKLIELNGFTLDETKLYLKSYFDISVDVDLKSFLSFTNNTPRVMSYVIGQGFKNLKDALDYLMPKGKTLNSIFHDTIEAAKNNLNLNEHKKLEEFFKLLIFLPRPVPIGVLNKILQVGIDFIDDISTEIWSGLKLQNSLFSFRDEDFENYIRSTFIISLEEKRTVANHFLRGASSNIYMSRHLGEVLYGSDKHIDLCNVVLDRKYLSMLDSVLRSEVYIQRTKLAIKSASKFDNNLVFHKLLIIGAEQAKSKEVLFEILVKYPDLLYEMGDKLSLNKLNRNANDKLWAGSFHSKLAGIYSRKKETHDLGKSHLKQAYNWISWKTQINDNNSQRKYDLTADDISMLVESKYWIYGIKEALQEINNWRPKEIRLEVGLILKKRMLLLETKLALNFQTNILRIDVILFLFSFLDSYSENDLRSVAKKIIRVLNFRSINIKVQFYELIYEFCEVLLNSKIESTLVEQILLKIPLQKFESLPSLYSHNDTISSLTLSLKVASLMATLTETPINSNSFFNKNILDKYNNREYKKLNTFLKSAIKIFQFNSDFYSTQSLSLETKDIFCSMCNKLKSKHNFYELGLDRKFVIEYFFKEIAFGLVRTKRFELAEILFEELEELGNPLFRIDILEILSSAKEIEKTNLKVLSEIIDILKGMNMPSSEKIDHIIRCTKLALPMCKVTGIDYFDYALESMKELDFEANSKILCISNVVKQKVLISDPKLAYDYSRFIEFCHSNLDGYDSRFPYKEIFNTIGAIDKSSLLPILTRWHHRGVMKIPKYILIIIDTLLDVSYIEPSTASSLLAFVDYYSDQLFIPVCNKILKQFDEQGDSSNKSIFVENLFRELTLYNNEGKLKELLSLIENGRYLKLNILTKIKNHLSKTQELFPQSDTSSLESFIYSNTEYTWERYKQSVYTDSDLEECIKSIESEDANTNYKIIAFLDFVVSNCQPQNYTHQLDYLLMLDRELISSYSLEEIFSKALTEWKYHSEVKSWKANNFKKVFHIWFDHFYDLRLNTHKIKTTAELFDISNKDLTNILNDLLFQKLDILSDESIYDIISLMTPLDNNETKEFLRWVLSRWNLKIDDKFSDGLWNTDLIPKESKSDNIALFLKFFLGHPNRELRWKGMHSLRRLVTHGNYDILGKLIKTQNIQNCEPFQNKSYLFYWISSKLYLWIAIERISRQSPKAIVGFKKVILKELFDTKESHMLIVKYVRQICLNLLEYDSSFFEHSIISKIRSLFDSIPKEEVSKSQSSNYKQIDVSTRFIFNELDTIPYWYGNLARVFNISTNIIVQIADKYIIEYWGCEIDKLREDYIYNQLDDGWHSTSHRQGGIPKVENLERYYEYHAMFYAASELVKKYPIVNKYHYCENELLDWLNRYSNSFDEFWLSDLVSSIPLESQFTIKEDKVYDKNWRDNISISYFNDVLSIDDSFVVVNSNYTRYIGENTEKIEISSCLVSKKGSHALLRAFHSAFDQYNCYIPYENEDDVENSINTDGLILKGWLINYSDGRDGIDKYDKTSYEISKQYVKFGDVVKDHLNLNYSECYKNAYIDDELISKFESWNNVPEDIRYAQYYLYSGGNRLSVSMKFIKQFLKKIDMNLIIKCVVNRQLKEREYEREIGIRPWEHVKIFLIKSNGDVKTIRG